MSVEEVMLRAKLQNKMSIANLRQPGSGHPERSEGSHILRVVTLT